MPLIATIASEAEYPENGMVILTANTPNGWKVSIYLELLGLSYYELPIEVWGTKHKEEWFTQHNPNGRIPVLLDIKDGKITPIWESVAILIYLGEKYDSEKKYYHSIDHPLYYEQMEALIFQASAMGPIQGQLHHFIHYIKQEADEYTLNRFKNEVDRIYMVLDNMLKKNGTGFFVGDQLNIADWNIWTWIHCKSVSKVDLNKFPAVKEFYERLCDNSAIKAIVLK